MLTFHSRVKFMLSLCVSHSCGYDIYNKFSQFYCSVGFNMRWKISSRAAASDFNDIQLREREREREEFSHRVSRSDPLICMCALMSIDDDRKKAESKQEIATTRWKYCRITIASTYVNYYEQHSQINQKENLQ